MGRGGWQSKTCKEVALAGAIEADDAVVHRTKRPTLRLLAVRLEAMDSNKLDIHGPASIRLSTPN